MLLLIRCRCRNRRFLMKPRAGLGSKRIVDRPGSGWVGERLGDALCPAPTLPDAVVLLAIGRPVRPHPRMFEEQLGKGTAASPSKSPSALSRLQADAKTLRVITSPGALCGFGDPSCAFSVSVIGPSLPRQAER